ncbi:MAG: type II toxin-antitoxin system PemK/MazF family toxin [Actinomycetota bacterium]|nr:type II toxin-antitoxin system PemK/MazF family toxin [Actinomycetota bacterium]
MRQPGLHRGSVWIAELTEPIGQRPVVVLTRDVAIPHLTNVTVALVTRTVRGIPSEVPLGPEEGLSYECVASCDNIHTIPCRWMARRVGSLSPEKLHTLARAIQIALDV